MPPSPPSNLRQGSNATLDAENEWNDPVLQSIMLQSILMAVNMQNMRQTDNAPPNDDVVIEEILTDSDSITHVDSIVCAKFNIMKVSQQTTH